MQVARAAVFASKSSAARAPNSNKVAVFIENAVRGSNIQWRGRSFAASIPSDSSQTRRSRKRLSKNERHAMVQSFVHKYRASNAGKFPTTSLIQKHIGGSYYVTKQILQELEHEYKVALVNKRDDFLVEKAARVTSRHFGAKEESQLSTGVEEAKDEATIIHLEAKDERQSFNVVEKTPVGDSINFVTTKGPHNEEFMEVVENSSIKDLTSSYSQLETREDGKDCHPRLSNESLQDNNKNFSGSQVSKMRSGTRKSYVASSKVSDIEDSSSDRSIPLETQSHQVKSKSAAQVLQPLFEEHEDRRKDATASKSLQNLDGQEREIIRKGSQEGSESENFHRDISKTSEHKEEPLPKRSTLWGNLKSLADGVMNFWKNM